MKLRCVNNDSLEGVLTIVKEYKGDLNRNTNVAVIYRCDDKKLGNFLGSRFEEVVDMVSLEPDVKINSYSLETGK